VLVEADVIRVRVPSDALRRRAVASSATVQMDSNRLDRGQSAYLTTFLLNKLSIV